MSVITWTILMTLLSAFVLFIIIYCIASDVKTREKPDKQRWVIYGILFLLLVIDSLLSVYLWKI